MLKKVVTGALVVVILGTTSVTGHAASSKIPSYRYARNTTENYVKIIQPSADQNIIFENNVLISVQVYDNATVSLKIYKQDAVKADKVKIEEFEVDEKTTIKGAVVLDDKIDQGEKFYQKRIKLSPGEYAIVSEIKDKDGKKQKPMVKKFTVKNKDEEVTKTLKDIQSTDALGNLLNKE
ncbi:hypothetical protein HNQ80_000609 [Anaerosolibacter carboniphilus]|uniref:Uncharacterized protein n=1 Tax=Anaerosolibacter carboniphilus TaxID=1417629 RepID=A0A841KWG7_9FIRM|nr:hypothetical protein [Anaerosolibacter carboniphilus]MBB6214529.1 hypothetical protein [Anaerosolibacter carboniphilus]